MVEKGSGGAYTQFVYAPDGATLAVYSGGLVKGTIPLPGGGTAVYNGGGLNFIRHKDWLGSNRLATTWAHAVYSKEAYAPFGETYNEAGTPDRSFTGQDQDVATGSGGTGVYDFLFHKYDPSAGRWLSPDPLGWGAVDQMTPQSLNRYAYVSNDPLSSVDPTGLQPIPCPSDLFSGVTAGDDGYVLVVNGCDDGTDPPTPLIVVPYDGGSWIDPNSYTPQVTVPFELLMMWAGQQTNPAGPPWHYGNWCGPGGMGRPINTLDTACMIHDFCYAKGGFSAADNNVGPTNGNLAGLQACNQALCDRAATVISSNSQSSQQSINALQVVAYFSNALSPFFTPVVPGAACKAN
jgi:RHS repeat-associated protein